MARNLWADIHLDAITHNYRLAKAQAPGARACAIIKADAYGHGAVAVARHLDREADAFGVACIEEALELREAGIVSPILLLEGFFEASELPAILSHQLWTAIHALHQIDALEAFAQEKGDLGGMAVWLKVDSGMHRLGLEPTSLATALARVKALPGVGEVVVMSHFASADEPDPNPTVGQLGVMDDILALHDGAVSLSNSAAVMVWPQAHWQWLRPGVMLYGGSPFGMAQPIADQLQPAMTLSTEIIAVRQVEAGECVGYGGTYRCQQPTRIGTLAVGYADGYSRHAPNGTPVYLSTGYATLAGRVSMDMVTIDLNAHPEAQPGDRVELWGRHVSVNDVARLCGTIPYTLLSGLTRRVKRRYL